MDEPVSTTSRRKGKGGFFVKPKAYSVCLHDKHSGKRVVKGTNDFKEASELVRELRKLDWGSTAYVHYNNLRAI